MQFLKKIFHLLKHRPHSDIYVIWNGAEEVLYKEPNYHDCMISYDGELISVQNIRKNLLRKGILPTIIFACQAGKPAYSMSGELVENSGGVFTLSWLKVLEQNPNPTYRDLIVKVNTGITKEIANDGLTQISEIICRKDVLDRRWMSGMPKEKHFVMILDMCRTPHPDPKNAKIVNDIDWL